MAGHEPVEIILFGALRDAAGSGTIAAHATTVAELRNELADRFPSFAGLLPSCRVAIDLEYANDSAPISSANEVAVIPPVSGGRDSSEQLLVKLTDQPIELAGIHEFIGDPTAGGNTVFTGTVRNHHQGKTVRSLAYEAYPAMAERMLAAIAGQALTDFPLARVAVVHRVGDLAIGDAAICVAASAAHRAETLDAVAWMMNRIKADVPVWKLETYADGSRSWVRCDHTGHQHD